DPDPFVLLAHADQARTRAARSLHQRAQQPFAGGDVGNRDDEGHSARLDRADDAAAAWRIGCRRWGMLHGVAGHCSPLVRSHKVTYAQREQKRCAANRFGAPGVNADGAATTARRRWLPLVAMWERNLRRYRNAARMSGTHPVRADDIRDGTACRLTR